MFGKVRGVMVPVRSLNFGFRNCDVNACDYVLAIMRPDGYMNYIPHGLNIQLLFASGGAMQTFGYANIWLCKDSALQMFFTLRAG